ncbi:MNIO family bufferin maturase [Roseibium sp. M-1]
MPSDPSSQTRTRVDAAIPARAGAGLKADHVAAILETSADIGFFEVHAENYMGAGGPPHRQLEAIRDRYPLSLHGVGLSIGGEGPLDKAHLERLSQLDRRYEPGLFSEHLAWSSHDTTYYNDLLPVPYDRPTLERVCDHIDEVQETVGRRMLLENPSTYVAFAQSTMSELDFLREITRRTGCGLLLDVNNVYVSCTNHARSAEDYLADFPMEAVGEIHLGGHAPDLDDEGRLLLIDAHDRAVDAAVWQLYESVIRGFGALPTLIEWDNEVPDWPVLLAQAREAEQILAEAPSAGLKKAG